MEPLLGFQVNFWDYATFAVLAVLVAAGLGVAVRSGTSGPHRDCAVSNLVNLSGKMLKSA